MTSPAASPPERTLPLLYLGAAHVALGLACLLTALWPQAVAGFFYHARLIAIVHLVTLGWITFSILGAIYIVGPLALRMTMAARKSDYVAYAFAVIGLIGMVGHFWIEEYAGMAWSAATISLGVLWMTARIASAVRRASMPASIKLYIILSCVNFWLAASMGLLIACDKIDHFLPGFVLSNVFAHAHLAAVGWATMMVVGTGYRLLPTTSMPIGKWIYASAIMLEVGVLGLFTTLLMQSAWTLAFGLVIVAGLGVFIAHVVWMVRHAASKPPGARRPDFGVLHAASAGLSLVVAAAMGLTLLVAAPSTRMLHLAAAYGVFGLVGFLAQMVVAMEARLLPPPSPHAMRDRFLQAIVFAGWSAGIPGLAAGLFFESAVLVGFGAWALFVGVAIGTLDNAFVITRALRTRRIPSREAA